MSNPLYYYLYAFQIFSKQCVIATHSKLILPVWKSQKNVLLFPLMYEFEDWRLASLANCVHDPLAVMSDSPLPYLRLCDWTLSPPIKLFRGTIGYLRCPIGEDECHWSGAVSRGGGTQEVGISWKEGTVANYQGKIKKALLTSVELFYFNV